MAALVTSLAILGAVQVAAAPIAHAATPPAQSCSWGDVAWTFGPNLKPWVVIDTYRTSLAPGSTLSKGKTYSTTNTVTVSISTTVATQAEAGVFFAKASVSAGVTLAASGSSASSDSNTTTISVTNGTTTQKVYVLYEAVRKVTMTAYRWQCDRFEVWKLQASAPLTSFAQMTENSIRCDLSYAAGSAEASAKTWC